MFNSETIRIVLIFLLLGMIGAILSGCGISNRASHIQADDNVSHSGKDETDRLKKTEPIPLLSVSSAGNRNMNIREQLTDAHVNWQGTPYQLGGETRNGIDCSAFTRQIFRDYFSTDLPRHTRAQLQEGRTVRRRSISTGDLIFFKTGRRMLHVGISMGNGDFLHASVSSGVMISNLADRYWASRYLGARRVL